MRDGCMFAAAFVILLAAAPATATTYVVNPDGTGDMATIGYAVAVAEAGDIIELTDGIFAGDGNRDISFVGKALTVRSQSGNPEACIIDCEGSEEDPHRGFSFTNGETSEAVLEGVTITNGWIGETSCGGAIQCRSGSSPTLINCRFTNCEVGCGGGIWCQNESNPSITDCVFSGNRVSQGGGGMFCTSSSPSLVGCEFLDNSADQGGGGVGCNFDSAPTFVNCTYARNFASDGAVLKCEDLTTPTFTNCTFVRNEADPGGRIVLCTDESSVLLANTIIAFCIEGAAVGCEGSAGATLTCCNLYWNPGGGWEGCIADQADTNGNLTADPLFCGLSNGDFSLCANSPCASENNTECGQIGAWPVGCESCETPVRPTTWGQIKASHR